MHSHHSGAACAAVALCVALLAAAGPTALAGRVGMRVLLVGVTPSDHYSVAPFLQALQARGIPHDYLDARAGLSPSQSLPLVDAATGVAKYYGVILSNARLEYQNSGGTYVSALTAAQWSQLDSYRSSGVAGYPIRMISGYSWPGFDGLSAMSAQGDEDHMYFDATWAGTADSTFNAAGAITMGPSIWLTAADPSGYSAGTFTCVSTFYTSSGADRGCGVGVAAETATGTETLHFFYASSEWVASHHAALSVAVTWLVRGMFVGERRILLGMHIDDHFLTTPEWDAGLQGHTVAERRTTAADMTRLADYGDDVTARLPTGSLIKYEIAYNANGVVEAGGYGADPLVPQAQSEFNRFYWLSHTYTHTNMDSLSYAQCKDEIDQNSNAATLLWGASPGPAFDPESMVTPQISGLFNGACLSGIADGGVHTMVGDNSRPELRPATSEYHGIWTSTAVNGHDGSFIVPRHATNVYYDNSEPVNNVAHYNYLAGTNIDFDDFMDIEATNAARHLLRYRPDPFMFHQSNTLGNSYSGPAAVGGQASLLSIWTEAVVQKVTQYTKLPIRSEPLKQLRQRLLERMQRDDCQADAELEVDGSGTPTKIDVVAGRSCTLAVSGPLDFATASGLASESNTLESTVFAAVSPATPVTIVLGSGAPGPCSSAPCQNGGTCTNDASAPGGYTCACTGGYTGMQCEVTPPCESAPCQNGGTCTNDAAAPLGYTCACAGAYTGMQCEVTPPCESAPCQNGGTCTNNAAVAAGYTCSCTGGYTGAQCEVAPPMPCDSAPCQNGGTCTNNAAAPGGYTCACAGGYTGMQCHVEAGTMTLGMRVLVLGVTEEDHAQLHAVTKVLQSRGMPYTYINVVTDVPTGASLPLTDPASGNGLYYAVMLASGQLGHESSPGVWTSALSSSQWDQLNAYLASNAVRCVSMQSWPGFDGLQPAPPIQQGLYVGLEPWLEAEDPSFKAGARAPLFDSFSTPADVSGHPNAVIAVRMYNSDAPGAADTGGVSAAVLTNAAGAETLHFFMAVSQWYAGQVAIANVAVQWAVRGVFIGQRRIVLSPQIDDLFLQSPEWTGPGNGNSNTVTRCSADDMLALKAFQDKLQTESNIDPSTGFKYEWAFNGAGVDDNGGYGVDPLANQAVSSFQDFYWVSHTHTHTNLDALTNGQCRAETSSNVNSAQQLWGANPGAPFEPSSMVTPQISGLFNGPCLAGLAQEGITSVVGDNSRPELRPTTSDWHGLYTSTAQHGYSGMFLIPRHATNIYYDNSLPENNVAHYNFITNLGVTWQELLQKEADAAARQLLLYRADPFMFHQANTIQYPSSSPASVNGKASLLSEWTQAVVDEVARFSTFPVANKPMAALRQGLLDRMARDTCTPDVQLTMNGAVPGDIIVSGASLSGDCELRISGKSVGAAGDGPLPAGVTAEQYGAERTLVMALSRTSTVTLAATDGTGPDYPTDTCPNDCSGHGRCVTPPVCACLSGWTGADCSTVAVPGWSANLLSNSGFESVTDKAADGWQAVLRGYKVEDKPVRSGEASIEMKNKKTLHISAALQKITFDPPLAAGSTIRISGWAAAKKVEGSLRGGFAIFCALRYTNRGGVWAINAPFATGTHDFEESVTMHVTKKEVGEAWCYAHLLGHKGEAWFDDLEFRVQQAGGVALSVGEASTVQVQVEAASVQETTAPISVDGRCGTFSDVGAECGAGSCCSQYGWCGTSDRDCTRRTGCSGCLPGTSGPCIDAQTGECTAVSPLTGKCPDALVTCDQFTHVGHTRAAVVVHATSKDRMTTHLRAALATKVANHLKLTGESAVRVASLEALPDKSGVVVNMVLQSNGVTAREVALAVGWSGLVSSLRTAGDRAAYVPEDGVTVQNVEAIPVFDGSDASPDTSSRGNGGQEGTGISVSVLLVSVGVTALVVGGLSVVVQRCRSGKGSSGHRVLRMTREESELINRQSFHSIPRSGRSTPSRSGVQRSSLSSTGSFASRPGSAASGYDDFAEVSVVVQGEVDPEPEIVSTPVAGPAPDSSANPLPVAVRGPTRAF